MNRLRFQWTSACLALVFLCQTVTANAQQKNNTKSANGQKENVTLQDAIAANAAANFFAPNHRFFQYTGRIDFANPKLPRYWQPGVYVSFRFKGNSCAVLINDEELWGTNHNYLEVEVDGKPHRLQTKSKQDTISLTAFLSTANEHEVLVMKNTEANIGYIEFAGVLCEKLIRPTPKPERKIECIGNSITCGASADMSEIPCGKGKWHDQHNAYLSYGATMARSLNAQVHLSSVSGIGLMRSCCNLNIVMPKVFDKVSMRNDSIVWNFSKYQPNIVTICLGQNDGVQDSSLFVNNYVALVKKVRSNYPNATLLLISSPMADNTLRNFLRNSILAVQKEMQVTGDQNLFTHVFEKSYTGGCDYHPSVEEHAVISKELTAVVKQIMHW